jgi:hypothetical protein
MLANNAFANEAKLKYPCTTSTVKIVARKKLRGD